MININKDANSTIIVTLAEKTTLATPYYLFVFTSSDNKDVIFTATDLTEFSERYNKFLVTETSGTEILTSGVVTLSPTGFWSYKIYEQESPTNLLVANTTSLVEQGRVNVIGETTTHKKYSKKRTYKSYGKGSGI